MPIKISIEAIEAIDAIARKGSFAAAAASLFKVPSALTYTIRKLEQDLNVSLFDRSGHRAVLTKAGEEILKEGRLLLDSASTLESRIRHIATGIENDLCIDINELLSQKSIFKILKKFYAQNFGTQIKLTREVYGGSWDALLSGRADICIGAPGDVPPGTNFTARLIGHVTFVFAVAPTHPLAFIERPLEDADIIAYRSVAAADSSRNSPPRTIGILKGQDILTVADGKTKIEAQIEGLGIGYLPLKIAEKYALNNQLVIKSQVNPRPDMPIFIAWRNHKKNTMGRSQQWLLKEFEEITLDELIL